MKSPENYSFYFFYKLSLMYSLSSARKFYTTFHIFCIGFSLSGRIVLQENWEKSDSGNFLPGVLNGGNFFIEGGKFASQNPQNLEIERQVYLWKQHGNFPFEPMSCNPI